MKKYLLILLFSINLCSNADFKKTFTNYFPKSVRSLRNFALIAFITKCIGRNLYHYKQDIGINKKHEKINIKDLKDAPEEIIQWCKSILQKYEIPNSEIIKFKICTDFSCPWAAFKDYILIDEKIIEKLKILIKNNDFKLNFHEFALLHETGHIVFKDRLKNNFIQLSLLPGFILSNLFEKFLTDAFSLNNSDSYKVSILKNLISVSLLLPSIILTTYIQTQISRYQENNADEFAIKKLILKKHTEGVDSFKKELLEDLEDINELIGMSRKELSRKICKQLIKKKGSWENVKKEEFILKSSRYDAFFSFRDGWIYKIYKMFGDKTLTFEDWLKSKPNIIRFLHWSLDAEHYYPQDRIDSINKIMQSEVQIQAINVG